MYLVLAKLRQPKPLPVTSRSHVITSHHIRRPGTGSRRGRKVTQGNVSGDSALGLHFAAWWGRCLSYWESPFWFEPQCLGIRYVYYSSRPCIGGTNTVLSLSTRTGLLCWNPNFDYESCGYNRRSIQVPYSPQSVLPKSGLGRTEKIWRVNLARLHDIENIQSEATKLPALTIDQEGIMSFASNHYENSTNGKGRWNGRQIRNSFLIASALARYEKNRGGRKDDTNPCDLNVRHFKTIVTAGVGFEKYLCHCLAALGIRMWLDKAS